MPNVSACQTELKYLEEFYLLREVNGEGAFKRGWYWRMEGSELSVSYQCSTAINLVYNHELTSVFFLGQLWLKLFGKQLRNFLQTIDLTCLLTPGKQTDHWTTVWLNLHCFTREYNIVLHVPGFHILSTVPVFNFCTGHRSHPQRPDAREIGRPSGPVCSAVLIWEHESN